MSNKARKKYSKTQKSGRDDDSSVELTISKVYIKNQKIQEAKQKNIIEFEFSPDKQKEMFKVRIQKVLCIKERRHLHTS